MPSTFRERVTRAAFHGIAASALTVAAQYFIGIPLGHQPGWLGQLANVAAIPAQYVIYPMSDVLNGADPGSLTETMTPFGPALREGTSTLLLLALGTIVIVALVDYIALGVVEMLEDSKRHTRAVAS